MSVTSSGFDPSDHALAAEYVLHLLDAEARRAVEDRIAVDGAFRRLVMTWAEDLAELSDEIPPAAPPPAVRRRMWAMVRREGAPGRRRRNSAFWTGIGIGFGTVAAFILAVALLFPDRLQPTGGPFYAAFLEGETGITARAVFDQSAGAIAIGGFEGAAPEGRVLELWVLPVGAESPTSLGVLPEQSPVTVTVPSDVAETLVGGLIEISEEPVGGSPSDGPTGRVLGVGTIGAE